jgi:hypothetical protein
MNHKLTSKVVSGVAILPETTFVARKRPRTFSQSLPYTNTLKQCLS